MSPPMALLYRLLLLLLPITYGTALPVLGGSPPANAVLVSQYLNSFSIEFKDFPLFAGNATNPNQFSINLLSNLGNRTGVMPMIRVGGTTQDDAIFISSQTENVITIGTTNGTHRAGVTIGPSFFSSYGTFPETLYIPGVNLAVNTSAGITTREWEAAYISKTLGDKLEMLEIGNEPDEYLHWNRRPASWNASDYVAEWQNASQVVAVGLSWTNPELAKKIGYFAPSFGGTHVGTSSAILTPLQVFQHGLDANKNIQQLSIHNYMGSATSSSITLQHTLMNHTAIVNSIANHVTLAKELQPYTAGLLYIMGETNSLSGGGASGISDVFGAALWVVDYALWQATVNITRAHFHQSSTSPYAAWSPNTSPPVTNAPYYGHLMVAAAVGSFPGTKIAYLNLGNGDNRTSAYVLYEGSTLARVVILNMIEHLSNSTTPRPNSTFSVDVPTWVSGARVERLTAAGADALSNITFAGVSYDYDLAEGRPVIVDEAATKEMVKVENEVLSVVLQDSEGVILHLL